MYTYIYISAMHTSMLTMCNMYFSPEPARCTTALHAYCIGYSLHALHTPSFSQIKSFIKSPLSISSCILKHFLALANVLQFARAQAMMTKFRYIISVSNGSVVPTWLIACDCPLGQFLKSNCTPGLFSK